MITEFGICIEKINKIISEWEQRLILLSDETISLKKNGQNRNIKQILGHLIDSASNNHQRIVRLQYNEHLVFPDYTQDNDRWISLQDYQHTDWTHIIQLWKYYNLHIIQLIKSVDHSKLANDWTDFEGTKVTLKAMVLGYPEHLSMHMNEINELIK